MVSSRDTSRSGQSGSCSHYAFILARSCPPFCGSAPGGTSCLCSHLPSSGNLLYPCLASPCGGVSCPRFALPYYTAGSNASGFAAAAFSALLASSMLAVPLPGLVWHPRPAVLPLLHAHRLPRIRLRPRQYSWLRQQGQEGLGLHGPHSEHALDLGFFSSTLVLEWVAITRLVL